MKLKASTLALSLIGLAIAAGYWLAASPEARDSSMPVSAGSTKQRANRAVKPGSATKPMARIDSSQTLTPTLAQPTGKLLFPALQWHLPTLKPRTATSSVASLKIDAVASAPSDRFTHLTQVAEGERVSFPLDGEMLNGVVNLVRREADGQQVVAGGLVGAANGSFALTQSVGVAGVSGHIINKTAGRAYTVRAKDRMVTLERRPLDAAMCTMPRHRGPETAAVASTGPVAAATIPLLNSRTSAAGVIYLDFDGEEVQDPDWNSGVLITAAPALMGSSAITAAQITEVWERVAEDFRPFNVNVTTDRAKYNAAGDGRRALAIITPTDAWYGGSAGGVAYLRSYRGTAELFSSTVPCWIWNNSNAAIMAMTISHEVGHMLDLSHDGTSTAEYYAGHDGTGPTSWGPIMGAPFTRKLVQWSRGEYPVANNPEDDLSIAAAVIAEPVGGSGGYAPDLVGDDTAHAAALNITSPINASGIIETYTDVDFYSLKSAGGPAATISVVVQPAAVEPNLDCQVEIYSSAGTLLGTSTQSVGLLSSTLTVPSTASGIYYIAVRGRARPTGGLVTGYSNYGNTGRYTISGSFVPLPELPLFTAQPASQTLVEGNQATLAAAVLSNSAVTYQWYKVVGSEDQKVAGKTTPSLAFPKLKPSDRGTYKLIATNAMGAQASDTAVLDVLYKPYLTPPALPAKQTVNEGTTVTLTINADGTAPMAYQWMKNKVPLAGETNASLSLASVDWFDIGSYTVAVSNTHGSVTSTASALTITAAPDFTIQPPSEKHIPLGGTASVTTAVVGTGPLVYQWYHNGSPYKGGTKPVLAWSAIKPEMAGTYYLRVTGPGSLGFIDSTPMVVDVQERPIITAHPTTPHKLAAEQTLNLTCAASGTPTLLYQWQLNGLNLADSAQISGATTPSLTVNSILWPQRGKYTCVVSNAVGAAVSKAAIVDITSFPVIVTQPVPVLKIATGKSGTLKVVAGGTAPFKYQWYKDDAIIDKATAASLTLAKASVASTNGRYKVVVTNTQPAASTGPIVSSESMVFVEDPPVPAVPSPLTQTVGIGDTVTITGGATGSPTMTYRWQKNSKDIIPYQTDSSLVLTNVQLTDAGSYRFVVRNDVGVVNSKPATLVVQTRPLIAQQPTSITAYEYDDITFTAKATGSATLVYQWYHNGSAITNNATAKTVTLKIPKARFANAGNYYVTATNKVGVATSNTAILSLTPVPAPILVDARPNNVVVGSKIYVWGSNLNWTTKVTVNDKAASFIKNRASELLVTVPTGLAAIGSLVVETYGGTVAWSNPITKDSNGAENDFFLDAKILVGSKALASADNTNATNSSGDYFVDQGKTLWFRWKAPSTSSNVTIRTSGSDYHHGTTIFSGPQAPSTRYDLTYIGWFDDHKGFNYPNEDLGVTSISVEQGTDYYFMIDSAHPTNDYRYAPNEGWTSLEIMVGAGSTSDGIAEEAPSEPAAVTSVGTGSSATAQVAALAASAKPILRAVADVTVQAAAGSDEGFSLDLRVAGKTISGLLFKGSDQSIHAQSPQGLSTPTGQAFVPGEPLHVELILDRARRHWTATLDGIVVAEGDGVSPGSFTASELVAVWRPGSSRSGTLEVSGANLMADDLPPATIPVSMPLPPPSASSDDEHERAAKP